MGGGSEKNLTDVASADTTAAAERLRGIEDQLTEMNARLARLEEAIAAREPDTEIALAADAVMCAAVAPARLNGEVLAVAYQTPPPVVPAPRLSLVEAG